VEPFACSLHGVERGNIQFRDVVVVSGCGPVGLGMVAGARQKNPKCLIALDLFDWKVCTYLSDF
jgi:threonine dehydrogenase-like Zn-dependent dehydrogenase